MIDRSEVSRALAKAIAYKECGKDIQAGMWAIRLIKLLECAEILRPYPGKELNLSAEAQDILGQDLYQGMRRLSMRRVPRW